MPAVNAAPVRVDASWLLISWQGSSEVELPVCGAALVLAWVTAGLDVVGVGAMVGEGAVVGVEAAAVGCGAVVGAGALHAASRAATINTEMLI